MSTATLSSKGQLVIPSQIRQALHLQPGDKVTFSLEGKRLVLEPQRVPQARLAQRLGRKVLVAPLPKFVPKHWRTAEAVFLAAGFRIVRQEGSHRSYVI